MLSIESFINKQPRYKLLLQNIFQLVQLLLISLWIVFLEFLQVQKLPFHRWKILIIVNRPVWRETI